MSELLDNVARGSALLDERMPGWFEKIDAGSLNIASCSLCVLGQMFGSYGDGLRQVGLAGGAEHGFAAAGNSLELNAAWRDVIARHRLAKVAVLA